MQSHRLTILRMTILAGLSLSIGWGIRGNFGHEYGAMIPGTLAAIAAVLISGRQDWWRRVAYFAMFGALGWSFGGSISYMRVIASTHSGHLETQIYGFACLFVIGFAWGAMGGAGTSLPAVLDRDRLTALLPPILTVLVTWFVAGLLIPLIPGTSSGSFRHESPLYWYDTSWVAAYLAVLAALVFAIVRGRFCSGTSFILHLSLGWWAGFLFVVFMVDGLGMIKEGLSIEFRMTPPRGDNWAGALGMTGGALVYFWRTNLIAALHATLVTGFFGGFGFIAATFLKLVEVKFVPLALSGLFGESGWQTNWHSILEQTYGLFNGIGLAVAMFYLARRVPERSDEPRLRPWTEVIATAFVLVAITYVNMSRNVPTWIKLGAVPADLYGVSTNSWFRVGYAILAAAIVALLVRHLYNPLALIPESWLGKGQLLYLVFLWWMVVGNLMLAIPPFQAQRLITEGVIHLNAVVCMVLVLVWPQTNRVPDLGPRSITGRSVLGVTVAGLVGMALTVAVASCGTRLIHGDAFVGHAGKHIRFGPDAETGKPQKGKPHP